MSCQCEIYEICPECGPEQYEVAARDYNNNRSKYHPKFYTLYELEQLAREFIIQQQHQSEYPTGLQLILSLFIQWARKREREVGE